MEIKDKEEKEIAIEEFTDIHPSYAPGFFVRAFIQTVSKKRIHYYNKAIAIDENFAKAYYNRGYAKSSIGDQKGAIEDYDKAIALNPSIKKS